MPDGSGVAPIIAGVSEDKEEHSQEDVEAPSSYPPSSDRLERQLARSSSFCTSRAASAVKAASGLPLIPILDWDDEGTPGGRVSSVPLSLHLQDNSVAVSRKRRRLLKAVMHEPSRSK